MDITQANLAAAVGVSRSLIAGIETGRVNATLDVVMRIGNALDLDLQIVGQRPVVIEPRPSGVLHGRCSAYVGRRLVGRGWSVRREVEIVHGRWHGWIDVLAFHPGTSTLVIIEIKTQLDDLGAIERQLSWYERAAPDVAGSIGWRPTKIVTWLLLLQTEEVETSVRRERDVLRVGFPVRASQMLAVVDGGEPPGLQRGFAMLDPSSRRADWLIPSRLDGRRSRPRYQGYADAARQSAS